MNAHARIVKSYLHLEVDKWGIIKEAGPEDAIKDEVNTANNHSEEEYELVPVTAAEKQEAAESSRGRGSDRGK